MGNVGAVEEMREFVQRLRRRFDTDGDGAMLTVHELVKLRTLARTLEGQGMAVSADEAPAILVWQIQVAWIGTSITSVVAAELERQLCAQGVGTPEPEASGSLDLPNESISNFPQWSELHDELATATWAPLSEADAGDVLELDMTDLEVVEPLPIPARSHHLDGRDRRDSGVLIKQGAEDFAYASESLAQAAGMSPDMRSVGQIAAMPERDAQGTVVTRLSVLRRRVR